MPIDCVSDMIRIHLVSLLFVLGAAKSRTISLGGIRSVITRDALFNALQIYQVAHSTSIALVFFEMFQKLTRSPVETVADLSTSLEGVTHDKFVMKNSEYDHATEWINLGASCCPVARACRIRQPTRSRAALLLLSTLCRLHVQSLQPSRRCRIRFAARAP